MILFFLGLFVFDWDYFWLVFPIAGIASWGVREAVKLSDDDEKLYEELKKKDDKDRAERLRLAAERRRSWGSSPRGLRGWLRAELYPRVTSSADNHAVGDEFL